MTDKEIRIKYHEFGSAEEMNPEDRELVAEAIHAMSGSYAPYSHFNVGAAVRMSNGQIVRGANQENAAFPSGLCAERTAMQVQRLRSANIRMDCREPSISLYGRCWCRC